ncbi:hypothetical protein JCM8208_007363 [Rhodotorula glutinis]
MARSRSRSDVDRTPTSDHHHLPSSAPYPPTPDLFLLCRPPPSSSRHELDVQVQLVQPAVLGVDPAARRSAPEALLHARPDTPASTAGRSFDAVAGAQVGGGSHSGEEQGHDHDADDVEHRRSPERSRSPSISSTRTGTSRDSTYTDGTSASGRSGSASTGGGGGGAGGKRRIVPLLALEYHTLLPTTVNDAGTGQRVARFHRRGIELTGLTMLDPTYLSSTAAASSPSSLPGAAPEPSSPAFLAVPGTTAASPHPIKPDSGSSFFTKLKRRSATLSSGVAVPPSPTTTTSSSPSSSSSSAPDSLPTSPHLLSLVRTPSPPSHAHAHAHPQHPRTDAGYAFLLRKWLRSDLVDAPRTVRIEWTRAPLRRRPVGRRPRSEVEPGLGRGVGVGTASAPGSRRGSENGQAGAAGAQEGDRDEDEGEPDEEEEERAWLCSLVYPLSGIAASPSLASSSSAMNSGAGSTSQASSPAPSPPLASSTSAGFLLPPSSSSSPSTTATVAPSPTTRRLLLATLRPAPHHPKLVSTLLLPPSLPSIPLGAFHPSRGLVGGALAPEDLRDLAMVTALWVAVRERLGGLEGVAGGEGGGGGAALGAGGALGLAASRSAGGPAGEGQDGAAMTGAGGVAAQLTEKAGLALQTGTKRASRASGFVGRLFGAR